MKRESFGHGKGDGEILSIGDNKPDLNEKPHKDKKIPYNPEK